MQSGVFWGYICLIEGLVRAHQGRVRRADDRRSAPAASPRCSRAPPTAIDHFDHDLTIRGLLEIDRRNPRPAGRDDARSPDDELVFLPLGGSNEIGMNFNLYGYGPPHARKWIVVDLGVTFGDQTTPGVEIILPDPELHRGARQGHPRHRADPRP